MIPEAKLKRVVDLLLSRFAWPDDEDSELKEAASILKELGPQAIPGLIEVSMSESPGELFAAAYGMSVLGYPEFLPHLARVAKNPAKDSTRTAFGALLAYGEEGAGYFLEVLNTYEGRAGVDWAEASMRLYDSTRNSTLLRGLAQHPPEMVFAAWKRFYQQIATQTMYAFIRRAMTHVLWELCYYYGLETTLRLPQTDPELADLLKNYPYDANIEGRRMTAPIASMGKTTQASLSDPEEVFQQLMSLLPNEMRQGRMNEYFRTRFDNNPPILEFADDVLRRWNN